MTSENALAVKVGGYTGPPDFGTKSHTRRDVKLTILGTSNTITLPLEVSTKVAEVKAILSQRIGVEAGRLRFTYKVGAGHRNLLDTDEIRSGIIRGINSWTREKAQYPHPFCIIGAGAIGLRQGLMLIKKGLTEFVVYDKLSQIGGRAWVKNANSTSKLQTELGQYHLQYGPDDPIPRSTMKTWPTAAELLQHFHDVSVDYGLMPHIQLNTNVTTVRMVMDDTSLPFYDGKRQHYDVATSRDDNQFEEDMEVSFSVVMCYPGGLCTPVDEELKGENLFDGLIGSGTRNNFDYTGVSGKVAAIVGFGAFAVENVRTCLENKASKAWMICRRKNITMPRVISWFANQGLYPAPCAMILDALRPMFDLIPDDPWTYYSVQANTDRTIAAIRQRSRFGISDVLFLACYYKKVEILVDSIKRLRPQLIVLESGDPLPADIVIKVFGFKGDFEVDNMMGTKEMVGRFVNGDWRRYIAAEMPGVDCNKLSGTSLAPYSLEISETMSWIINYPIDMGRVFESGMLPKKKANKEKMIPAYVWDPRTALLINMIFDMIPGLSEISSNYGLIAREKELGAHPMEQYIDECADEWKTYCRTFQDASDNRPFPPYPYTHEFVRELCERNDKEGEQDMMKRV